MAVTMNSFLLGDSGAHGPMLPGTRANYPELVGAFYSAQYRYVLRICQRYLWRREDAEDAAAEVFLKLHALKSEEFPARLRSWLSKVAGRHCIDKLRKTKVERRRCGEDVECDSLPQSPEGSPLSRVLRREEQEEVREALRRLPRDYRILLVLHFYRQLSYMEIAARLGKHLPAVKTGVFRAKRLLRDQMLNAPMPIS
jgi:RNA polymerase sigma-70 factor (ECF subfamily)